MNARTRHDRHDDKPRRHERHHAERAGRRPARAGSPRDDRGLAALLDLLSRASASQTFDEIRDALIPMLPRREPPPDFGQVPVTTIFPPGIPVGFAIDSEHAYAAVLAESLAEWGVDARAVALAAISNLRRRAEARDPREVQAMTFGGLPARALRPLEGWESALILAPDLLERFFGPGPLIVAAPLRPVLLAFDPDADPEQVRLVVDALASSDPRGLALDPMRLEGGSLAVIRVAVEAAGGADPVRGRRVPPA